MGFKQLPLTLTLSRRGRGEYISVLFSAKVNLPWRGNNINSLKRTYSPKLVSLITHHSSLKKKAAFTLAEILITLGIIGVVAVLTLSTVIQNIQNKQNIAKWKKEYSVINNAFNEVVADGVEICEAYSPSSGNLYIGTPTDDYYNAMMSKLRVVDYCGSSSLYPRERVCDYTGIQNGEWWRKNGKYKWSGINGSATLTGYKALGGSQDSRINNYNFSKLALLLADGAVVYLGEGHGGPWIVVDVNNFNEGPNQFGKDVLAIKVTSNIKTGQHYLKAIGAEGTYNKQANGDVCECSKDKGAKSADYIAGAGGTGEVISGACCSAKYLME